VFADGRRQWTKALVDREGQHRSARGREVVGGS
jgi:hypothetical protein